jgi:hypothetical protein
VHPDRRLRLEAGDLGGRRLQPIDADRLQITRCVLEADVEVVARLHHLPRGLRIARLVAVDRWKLEKAGKKREQREDDEHDRRTRA